MATLWEKEPILCRGVNVFLSEYNAYIISRL